MYLKIFWDKKANKERLVENQLGTKQTFLLTTGS